MYHPTTRLLTILELLQTHAELSGEALARRLEVEPRTIRRYIMMLQDMGMPIEATRGPGGGYRLRAGFKLPPLAFTEEEATALVLGLLGTAWLEVEVSAVAIEGALAKVSRVLPPHVRARVQAISAHLTLWPEHQVARPDAARLLALSEAIQQRQQITIDYRSLSAATTQRTVEPYGIVGWQGHWYLIGYCCLRQAYRVFRLDRIQQLQILAENFRRAEDFDCQAFLVAHYQTLQSRWQIEVEFQAPLYTVQEKLPASYGSLTATPTGVLFQGQYEDLPGMARYLVALGLPFVIHQPPELRVALRSLAEEMLLIASVQPTA